MIKFQQLELECQARPCSKALPGAYIKATTGSTSPQRPKTPKANYTKPRPKTPLTPGLFYACPKVKHKHYRPSSSIGSSQSLVARVSLHLSVVPSEKKTNFNYLTQSQKTPKVILYPKKHGLKNSPKKANTAASSSYWRFSKGPFYKTFYKRVPFVPDTSLELKARRLSV